MGEQYRRNLNKRYRQFSRGISFFVGLVAFVVLMGWVLNIQLFKSILPGLALMKPNTAFALGSSAIALYAFHVSWKSPQFQRAAFVFSILVIALGILTLSQYIWGWNFGIDDFFFKDPQTSATNFPLRPSFATSLNFFLIGMSLLLLNLRRWAYLRQALTLLVMAIAGVVLIGYLYGVSSLYAVFIFNTVAIHTAFTFFVLSIGILLATPDAGGMWLISDPGAGGVTVRRLLPSLFFIPLILGFLLERGQIAALYDPTISLALFVVGCIIIFGSLVWWNGRAVSHLDAALGNMESAKLQSDAQFRAAFDEALDVIFIVSGNNGHILKVNPIVKRVLGYEPERLIGIHFSLIFPEEAERIIVEKVQTYGHVFASQEFRRSDDSICLMDLTATLIPWDGDRAVLLTLRDVSERQRIELEIRKSETMRLELEKERELLNLKEDFIAAVSHDFRTPLTVIMTSNDILERYHDRLSDERRNEQLGRIRQQVFYMKDLLDDVLTLSKAHAQKLEFKPVSLDLGAFCKSLFEQIQLNDESKHTFRFVMHEDFHDAMMDEKLLQRILINLLTNAVKYSPDGGEVCLELVRDGDNLLLTVSDHGIGIPEADRLRLFDPFHRGANTQGIEGTGLGLAIVYESVQAHLGTIDVQSVVGQGTTFTVRMPIASPVPVG